MELTGLDLHYVVQELQLPGAKVEKIFQSDTNRRDLYFILYSQPKISLRFLLPGIICSSAKPAYPQTPPGFAVFLRKYLQGSKIQSITQQGFDRILRFEFSGKPGDFTLLVEMMAPGNMLLLDKENRIINLLENQNFKDRTLRGRQPYIAPPVSFNILAATDEELTDRITVSTKDSIVTTLAIHLGLGGIYAEEVCVRAGIAKQRNDLHHAEIKQVVGAIRDILKQPLAAHKDESRAYPFKLQSRSVTPCAQTSFLAAIGEFVYEEPKAEAKEHKVKENKLQAIITAQARQVERFTFEAQMEQRKAERIYEEYQLLQEILQTARDAREKKQDVRDALKKFEQVKGFKDATGEIEVEIDDEAR